MVILAHVLVRTKKKNHTKYYYTPITGKVGQKARNQKIQIAEITLASQEPSGTVCPNKKQTSTSTVALTGAASNKMKVL